MSDPFKVPEPSERAIKAVEFHPAEKNDRLTQSDRATILHAGYHVDVPAIVRAEVERALKAYEDFALNVVIGNVPRQLLRERNFVGEWCATRFGEPEGLKLGPSAVEIPVTFRKTDSGEVVGYAITPAERDFLRAIARHWTNHSPDLATRDATHSEVAAAAKRVVEEAK